MKKLLSLVLALIMCWSVCSAVFPAVEINAVQTGTAALKGDRYTVDWVIPEIGTNNVSAGNPGIGADLSGISYDILGYVSPKYGDDHATIDVPADAADGCGYELVDGTAGSVHFLNDPWVGLYGNEENAIIVDLKNHYTNLSQVKLTMLSSPENGIFLPSDITIATSADGETYNYVCGTEAITMRAIEGSNVSDLKYYVPTEYASVVYELVFAPQEMFKGTYVMIKFNHEVGAGSLPRYWTFVSEVDVQTSGEAVMPDYTGVGTMSTHDAPSVNPYDVNAALKNTYQIVGTVGTGLLYDSGRNELTNGIFGGTNYITDDNYVSVAAANGQFAIQLDLGSMQSNITSFEISGGINSALTGCVEPGSVSIYASDDNVNFLSVPLSATVNKTTNGTKFNHKYTVAGNNQAISARYIVIVVNVSDADGIVLLDEVVVNNTKGSSVEVNYAADSTYMYLGKTVHSSFNDDVWTGIVTEEGVPNINRYAKGDLNNGIYATGNFQDLAWVGYNHMSGTGDYVDIIFDLGEVKADINKVSFKLLDYTSGSTVSNCSVPTKFLVMYSDTDTNFKESTATVGGIVKTVHINTVENNRQDYVYYEATPNHITARYILLRIYKDKNRLFLDEVEIWSGNASAPVEPKPEHTPINQGFDNESLMSAVWLSLYDVAPLYLLNNTYQVDEQTYRVRLNNYLTAMDSAGINTIFLHARANGDRLYGSIDQDFVSVSPFSKRYTGATTAVATYDAFEIFLEEAHKKNMSVHAWLNPMRLSSTTDMQAFDSSLPIKQMQTGTYEGVYHTDYINLVNGTYWLNPGYQSVREHVVDAVVEVVANYDVDGVVIDDYFYPAGATNDFDQESYDASNYETRGEFRRANITELMRMIYAAIKAEKDIPFGISPAGNNIALDNGYYNSYNYATMYIDIRSLILQKWDDNGAERPYMDYVSPQLYWPEEALFASVESSWNNYMDGLLIDWAELCQQSSVKFMPSLGLYQAAYQQYDETGTYKDKNIILGQLELMYERMVIREPYNANGTRVNYVRGMVLYNSGTLYDDFSTPNGWYTDDWFTADYNLEIRNHLKTYWQNYNP